MRQQQALQVMLSGTSVFLTGAPGSGKTYVLNEFIRRVHRRGQRLAVTASTGIAATHIGGATVHAWSGLGIRDTLTQFDRDILSTNATLRSRYITTDILVIDEVSMLHGSRLDMLNELCKIIREDAAPFGGMQVVLVGDLFQLPPVSRGAEPEDFVHLSAAWAELDPEICYITEQHRQANDRLLDVLEAMRSGQVEAWHTEALQERVGVHPNKDTAVTRLYSHNVDVDSINSKYLQALNGQTRVFPMETHGNATKVEQLVRSVLAPMQLELKVGAEVMFVANDFASGFVNGSRGKIVSFQGSLPVVELLHNAKRIVVEPYSWALTEDGKKRAEVSQLPLRLAWAITIHKSQGMSLDAAEIDLSRSFTPGMGYVALSRVRSLDGIYLTGMNAMAMKLHPAIFEFDAVARARSALLAERTEDAADVTVEADGSQPAVFVDPILLERLKMWRTRRAMVDGVPPYIVAHDALLEALAAYPPHTARQLLAMPGIGAKKLDLYGDELLALLRTAN